MALKHVHFQRTTISVLYFLTALFYSDFTHADTFQYYTWRHERSRGKLHLNLPTQLLAWRLIIHYFVWFLVTERVLFVPSFYWHVTWMSVASYITTSDKWHKHCSKGWQCIDIWSFQFSHIQVIRYCSAQEHHISWTCVQFGSCFVTYKQQYQLLLHGTVAFLVSITVHVGSSSKNEA